MIEISGGQEGMTRSPSVEVGGELWLPYRSAEEEQKEEEEELVISWGKKEP